MSIENLINLLKMHRRQYPTSGKFFMGTDRTDEHLFRQLVNEGAVVYDSSTLARYSNSRNIWKNQMKYCQRENVEEGCFPDWIIMQKEAVVFDMWTLVRAEYFVGSWYSTFTQNVCRWRGRRAI